MGSAIAMEHSQWKYLVAGHSISHRYQIFLVDIRNTRTMPPNTPIPCREYDLSATNHINGWCRLQPQASYLAQVNNQSTIERFYSDLLVVLKVAQLFTSAIGKL